MDDLLDKADKEWDGWIEPLRKAYITGEIKTKYEFDSQEDDLRREWYASECEEAVERVRTTAACLVRHTRNVAHLTCGEQTISDGEDEQSVVLHPDDLMILQVLSTAGTTLTQEALNKKIARDVKTIGKRLARLRELGLTHRPDGERGGDAITETGIKALRPDSPLTPD